MGGNICSKPLDTEEHHWPSGVPPAVSAYWTSTGCDEILFEKYHTVTVPQAVDDWWLATGNAFFATKALPIPLPSLIPSPVSAPPPPLSTPPLTSTPSPPVAGSSVSPPTFTSAPETNNGSGGTTDSQKTEPSSTFTPSGQDTAPVEPTTASYTSSSFNTMSETTLPGIFSDPLSTTVSPDNPSPTTSSPVIAAKSNNKNNKTTPIVVGVVVPLALIILGVAAFIIYKRRQRARDRREWERTHEAIADAVRQVGAPAPAGLPAWNPARGDMKEPSDGDTTPLFDNFGGSHPKFE